MAWVEQTGENSWCARFRRPDGTIGDITGFTSPGGADNYALDMESDQRKGAWLDPTAGRLTNHIHPRWGDTALADISNLKVQTWKSRAGTCTHYQRIKDPGPLDLLTNTDSLVNIEPAHGHGRSRNINDASAEALERFDQAIEACRPAATPESPVATGRDQCQERHCSRIAGPCHHRRLGEHEYPDEKDPDRGSLSGLLPGGVDLRGQFLVNRVTHDHFLHSDLKPPAILRTPRRRGAAKETN